MKVLEQSELRLMIKDGSPWYKIAPLHNLFGEKWHRTIDLASGLGLVALLVAWQLGKIPADLLLPAKIMAFLLAAPLILSLATEGYQERPVYLFDKASGQLKINHQKASKSYALTDIVDVIAVTTASGDPPPTHWRKVCLVLQSGEQLELHPGHDQAQRQVEMVTLIRQFLNLDHVE